MNEPVLFIYRKEGGRQSEQSKKSEIRIHVTGVDLYLKMGQF